MGRPATATNWQTTTPAYRLRKLLDRVDAVTNSAYGVCAAAGACEPPSSPETIPNITTGLSQPPGGYVTWQQPRTTAAGGRRLPAEAAWSAPPGDTAGGYPGARRPG